MLQGFWKLTWIEMKVFMREPMGVIGTLVIPVLLFVVLGRALGTGEIGTVAQQTPFNVPVLAALFIAVSAVISLVTIISIYREGGILKRLRATPLSPVTILGAHVIVKLAFTMAGLALLVIAGRRVFPGAMDANLPSFAAALFLSTLSILSMGFVMASLVPTARFAQPLAAALLYPMIAVSGLFFP
ncbi:MAG: ABC transporter permease, partial [Gemmatimonadota bacterium]|nr:ABC transporter permease [Gemmatimonadota bacterium]